PLMAPARQDPADRPARARRDPRDRGQLRDLDEVALGVGVAPAVARALAALGVLRRARAGARGRTDARPPRHRGRAAHAPAEPRRRDARGARARDRRRPRELVMRIAVIATAGLLLLDYELSRLLHAALPAADGPKFNAVYVLVNLIVFVDGFDLLLRIRRHR